MWKAFLADWNGRSLFLNTTVTTTSQMELYTDASGTIGYGGYFNRKWFQGRWLSHMQLSRVMGISIKWQELFPIVVALPYMVPPFFQETYSILVR